MLKKQYGQALTNSGKGPFAPGSHSDGAGWMGGMFSLPCSTSLQLVYNCCWLPDWVTFEGALSNLMCQG